jgi:hypothetical protein
MSRFGRFFRTTAAAVLTAAGVAPAVAQQPADYAPLPDISDFLLHNQGLPSPVAPAGWGRTTAAPGYSSYCQPSPCAPCNTCNPCGPYSGAPGYPMQPYAGTPPTGMPNLGSALGSSGSSAVSFGGLEGGAGTPSTIGGAYIETAVPVTMVRLRFDAGYGMNRPDRAEFFYAKCGCFNFAPPPLNDPHARGPQGIPPGTPETGVDFQELTPAFEYAVTKRWSVFADIPVRWINPQVNQNAAGISDISFGTKYAFILNERRAVTAYFRTIAPSGDSRLGLGTSNWWVEPGILWLEQVTCKWQLFGEVRDQIPVAPQSDFTGNVLRYGLGTNYIVASGRWGYVAPTLEFVGWTVLSGKESFPYPPALQSASGDTIVNAKIGLRIGFGQATPGTPYPTRSDLYVGYGRALTGEFWYQDLFRLEYRFFF